MVNYSTPSLDAVFSALGDPTRRAILARLAQGETRVSELARPHDMSMPAISKHLRVLESAGLVRKEKHGRVINCSLAPDPLKDASDWIDQYRRFWEVQLDALAEYLDHVQTKEPEG
jgi:DNA-binding transcriptional ArsR family regulator